MPSKERYVPDHFLLFANEHFSFSVVRCIRTASTEGWHFFDGGKNIGTLIAIRQPKEWRVDCTFTVEPNPAYFWDYLIDFLNSIGIEYTFLSVHIGGREMGGSEE
jgi:hypothetical protein